MKVQVLCDWCNYRKGEVLCVDDATGNRLIGQGIVSVLDLFCAQVDPPRPETQPAQVVVPAPQTVECITRLRVRLNSDVAGVGQLGAVLELDDVTSNQLIATGEATAIISREAKRGATDKATDLRSK